MLDAARTAVTYSTGLYGGAAGLYALSGDVPALDVVTPAWAKMTGVLFMYLYVRRRLITTN